MAFEFIISSQPQEVTVVTNSPATFTVAVSSNEPEVESYLYQWQSLNTGTLEYENIVGATTNTYSVPHAIYNNPVYDVVDEVFVDTTVLQVLVSGLSGGEFQNVITSDSVELRVVEDVPPFDKLDVYPETGRERFRRLRLLGYI